jgi:hypothetical protein
LAWLFCANNKVLFSPIFLRSCFPYLIFCMIGEGTHSTNWKSWTSRAINALSQPRSAPAATTLWQREFFDHVVRSNESYAAKWNYVQENPVRAGLVKSADHWSYSAEIEILMLWSPL